MSLLRDAITNLFRSWRGFRGAAQVVSIGDGFWAAKEFRAYREFSMAQNGVTTIRFTATKAFLLKSQELYLDSGAVRAVIYTQPATEPGPWDTMPTRFGRYLLAGPGSFASTIDVSTTLGAITGGNEREVLRVAAGGGNNQGFGQGLFEVRALPIGVYYIVLTATGSGTSSGVYSIGVEELDT